MNVEFPEYFCRVEQMLVLKDPVPCERVTILNIVRLLLLAIPSQQREIQH